MDRSYIFLMIFIALTLSVEAAPDVDALVQESRSGLTPEQTREYRAMAADIGEDRGSGSESHETADTAPVMDEAKKVASTSEDTDAAPADNHRVLTDAQRKEFEDLNKQDGFPGEKSSQAEPVKATPDQEEFKATQAEVGVRRESGSEPHETADTAPVMDEAKKVASTRVAEPKVTQMTEDKHGKTSSPVQADEVTPVAKEDAAEPQPVAEPKVTQMTEDKHVESASWDVKSQDDDVADSVDEVEKEEMKELSGDPKDVIKRLAEQFEARKMMTSK